MTRFLITGFSIFITVYFFFQFHIYFLSVTSHLAPEASFSGLNRGSLFYHVGAEKLSALFRSHLFSLMNASDSEKEDTEIEVIAITPNEENSKLMKKEKKKKKKVSLKDAEKKGGVCYMSRIPPHMDHVKLRHILSQFGDIQRIFLAPQGLSLKFSDYSFV